MAAICSENIDFTTFGRYSSVIAAKSASRGRSLKVKEAHNRARSGFFMRNAQLQPDMVGWVEDSSESLGSSLTSTANSAQFTTSQGFAALGGGFKKLKEEAAIMATTPAIPTPEIRIINGDAVTTSLAIADYFTKRHDDVLKKIRAMECSPEFCARNFAETSLTISQPNGGTRNIPCYQITRDGFAFLAMGFTGKRAAQFKEAYITAFNRMESHQTAYRIKHEQSNAEYNLGCVRNNLLAINTIWDESLYPMLVAMESPLATRLHDRIKDALFCSVLVKKSLGGDL
ncbi:MAG: Rha family transcriptional regulator [Plesiomonas shigelloides]